MMLRILLRTLLLSLAAGLLAAQQDVTVDWRTALLQAQSDLDRQPPEATASRLKELRAAMAQWLAEHPNVSATLPALTSGMSREELRSQVSGLRAALDAIIEQSPGTAFHLGRVEVNVQATREQVATADRVEQQEFRAQDAQRVPDALNLMPGVFVQAIGARNERGVYIRGFDAREVPLYLDGIPVYVPYDGYVDFNRFLTFNVAEVQVAKGFTSPLYGPNAIGGAVNLVSQEPTKKLNLDIGTGYASGRQYNGYANIGSRFRKFYVQAGGAWLQQGFLPLSGNFQPTPFQPNSQRANSYAKDGKGDVRVAYTPNSADQYTFNYIYQHGEKGNPPYAGTDPSVRARFWKWPYWDKESFYFIGNKGLGETTYAKLRLYYDRFQNQLYSYDDATYRTQTRPSSFISPYDDHTDGGTLEFGTGALPRQSLKTSVYFKDDTHHEGNLGQPWLSFRDQSVSLGLQDTISLFRGASAVLGFSADHLDVLNAENNVNNVIQPFPTSSLWAYNPQAGLFYAPDQSTKLHFTFARKRRLPTIKDRYSYRMGQAIPNPFLQPEKSDNYEVGYTRLLGVRTVLEADLFRSNVSGLTLPFYLQPNLFQLQNLGDAVFQGAEFSVRSTLPRNFSFTGNYTYLNRKSTATPPVLLTDTPRHKVFSSLTYLWRNRFTLMGALRYEGRRWSQNEGAHYYNLASFVTLDVGATAQVAKGFSVEGGIRNLADRSYFRIEGYPEEGRNAYVNLRYRF